MKKKEKTFALKILNVLPVAAFEANFANPFYSGIRKEYEIMKLLTFTSLAMLLVALCAPAGMAEDVTADYLHGRWVINAQDCSAPDSEYVVFQPKGTFESSRAGKTEVLGFWGLEGDILKLHMLTTPAHFADLHKQLKEFEGVYGYYQARVLLFNSEKSKFQAVGVLGSVIKKATAVRCK
jgi:hypothetical protein